MLQDESPADAWIAALLVGPVLFDTMIIRHICQAGGADAIAAAFGGRFYWGEAVQAELSAQSRMLPQLAKFMATKPAIVLDLTPDEDKEVDDIRLDMYGRHAVRNSDTEHLGEAQCLYLAGRDGLPFVTNDNKARERARADWDEANNRSRIPGMHRIETFHVCDALLAVVRLGGCRPGRAWDLYDAACVSGLFERPEYPRPGSRERFLTEGSGLRALLLKGREIASNEPIAGTSDDS